MLVAVDAVSRYHAGDLIGGADVTAILANPEHAQHVEGLTIAGAVPATARYVGKPRFWYGSGAPLRNLGGDGCHYADVAGGDIWLRGRFGWRKTGAKMRAPANTRAGAPTAARARPAGMNGDADSVTLAPGEHIKLAPARSGRQFLSLLNAEDGKAHFAFEHPPVIGESWTIAPGELLVWYGDVLPDALHAVSELGTVLVVTEGF